MSTALQGPVDMKTILMVRHCLLPSMHKALIQALQNMR